METPLTELLNHKGSHVCHVEPEASIEEAADRMRQEKVGALLVLHGEEIVGIVTERDLLNRVVARDVPASTTRVHEIMSSEVVVVKPSLTVREAMQVLGDKHFRHLPVVKDGHLLGMISIRDLTNFIVAEEEGMIHTLMDYIQGTYPG